MNDDEDPFHEDEYRRGFSAGAIVGAVLTAFACVVVFLILVITHGP